MGRPLADLPPGAVVATGSVRRRAQLAWIRPDLTFVGLRGNIATRLERVPEGGAVVVAAAALERLNLTEKAAEVLAVSQFLPQVGQGAIAVAVGERVRERGGDVQVFRPQPLEPARLVVGQELLVEVGRQGEAAVG